jgi:hypothetical protein
MPEPAPERVWASAEAISEAAPEAVPEPSAVNAEPTAESILEAAPEPVLDFSTPRLSTPRLPSAIDPEWVHVIVRKVVMKMAPPALPAEQVEELVRVLIQEITAELDEAASQIH